MNRRHSIFAMILISLMFSISAKAQWKTYGSSTGAPIYTLSVIDTNVFAGGYGKVYRSTDAGMNWVNVTPGLIYLTSYRCSFVNKTGLFIGTGGSGVFFTTNNGASWSKINNNMRNSVVSSFAEVDSNIFAGTEGDGVFKSTDQGINWEKTNSGLSNYDVLSLAAVGSDLFVGTQGGGVYRSNDYGVNWTQAGLSGQYIYELFVNGKDIIASTGTSLCYLSTDNGESWAEVYSEISNSVILSFLKIGSNIVAGTLYGGVYLSTNNGRNWTSINDGYTEGSADHLVTDGTILFIGSNLGHLWRRPISEIITSINSPQSELPNGFYISQNYPNPFNHTTVIQYTLAYECNVSVTVYNNLGQIVRIFNEEEKEAGSYNLIFNGDGLSSGVYFYGLNTVSLDGNQKLSAIRKMLLLK